MIPRMPKYLSAVTIVGGWEKEKGARGRQVFRPEGIRYEAHQDT